MPISTLEITDFRNLRFVNFFPSPSVNWLVGNNGSGKTSVLEALYLLSTGKSFRSSNSRQFINYQVNQCRVVAGLSEDPNLSFAGHIGIERDTHGGIVARLNGASIRRLSDLARIFPLVTLLPDSVQLLTGDPGYRREFIDWSMFHVEHKGNYLDIYKNFNRCLLSRNQLLRDGAARLGGREREYLMELRSWDEQFIYWGDMLSVLRESFVKQLANSLSAVVSEFAKELGTASYDLNELKLVYSPGWTQGRSLSDQLDFQREKDLVRGTTTSGPQRFDMRVTYLGIPVKDYFSRGQLKHLTSLFKICQVRSFLTAQENTQIIFLFDDAFAELDGHHADSILSVLRSLGIQTFVTSVEPPESKGFSIGNHDKMFHVEHGCIQPVTTPILREQHDR